MVRRDWIPRQIIQIIEIIYELCAIKRGFRFLLQHQGRGPRVSIYTYQLLLAGVVETATQKQESSAKGIRQNPGGWGVNINEPKYGHERQHSIHIA